MPFLVAAAAVRSPVLPERFSPTMWRQVRQFNLPVQLALAAGEQVLGHARHPAEVGVVSIAPNEPGSYELNVWINQIHARSADDVQILRMKPTHTLHMVDNLALSAFAIGHGNHAECLGLGGAAGQLWAGLEVILEWFADGRVSEVVLLTGDQTDAKQPDIAGLGAAWLLTCEPRSCVTLGRSWELRQLQRTPLGNPHPGDPSGAEAARALVELSEMLMAAPTGEYHYTVPVAQTDGLDSVRLTWEVGP